MKLTPEQQTERSAPNGRLAPRTIKQRQLLDWMEGRRSEPPHYENGGLAAAMARIRKKLRNAEKTK